MFDAILHPFAWAISYVWVWIHDLLVLLGMSSGSGIAWVLSIVLLTILVRIAIIPLFLKQIRSSRAMQAIQPEMRKIQEKYKGKKDQVSRQKMMEETQALQRKHKVSPFASCLPMLVQMPVLFGMYRAIIAVSSISAGTYTYRGEATDHLGPLTWQKLPEAEAMKNSVELVYQYARAGFTKIHLDTSMKVADDAPGLLKTEVIARRGAQLYKAAMKGYEELKAEKPDAMRPVFEKKKFSKACVSGSKREIRWLSPAPMLSATPFPPTSASGPKRAWATA